MSVRTMLKVNIKTEIHDKDKKHIHDGMCCDSPCSVQQ